MSARNPDLCLAADLRARAANPALSRADAALMLEAAGAITFLLNSFTCTLRRLPPEPEPRIYTIASET